MNNDFNTMSNAFIPSTLKMGRPEPIYSGIDRIVDYLTRLRYEVSILEKYETLEFDIDGESLQFRSEMTFDDYEACINRFVQAILDQEEIEKVERISF